MLLLKNDRWWNHLKEKVDENDVVVVVGCRPCTCSRLTEPTRSKTRDDASMSSYAYEARSLKLVPGTAVYFRSSFDGMVDEGLTKTIEETDDIGIEKMISTNPLVNKLRTLQNELRDKGNMERLWGLTKWEIIDLPQSQHYPSSVTCNHKPGHGWNRGRLRSSSYWRPSNDDQSISYILDIGSNHLVGGIIFIVHNTQLESLVVQRSTDGIRWHHVMITKSKYSCDDSHQLIFEDGPSISRYIKLIPTTADGKLYAKFGLLLTQDYHRSENRGHTSASNIQKRVIDSAYNRIAGKKSTAGYGTSVLAMGGNSSLPELCLSKDGIGSTKTSPIMLQKIILKIHGLTDCVLDDGFGGAGMLLYASITFNGITRETTRMTSTLIPKWNETLTFSFDDPFPILYSTDLYINVKILDEAAEGGVHSSAGRTGRLSNLASGKASLCGLQLQKSLGYTTDVSVPLYRSDSDEGRQLSLVRFSVRAISAVPNRIVNCRCSCDLVAGALDILKILKEVTNAPVINLSRVGDDLPTNHFHISDLASVSSVLSSYSTIVLIGVKNNIDCPILRRSIIKNNIYDPNVFSLSQTDYLQACTLEGVGTVVDSVKELFHLVEDTESIVE